MARNEAARRRGQLVSDFALEVGAFYQGCLPGGFTDSTTGIIIPGPIVNIDETRNRQVSSISSLPDPVQIPHKKLVEDYKDKDRKVRESVEVAFDRNDEAPLHTALFLALQTGIIRRITDEEVEARYPEAWAKRRDSIVFSRENAEIPMLDLIAAFHDKVDAAKAESNKKIKNAVPPPPPAKV